MKFAFRHWVVAAAAVALPQVLLRQASAQTSPIVTGSISGRLVPFATIAAADGAPQDLVSANDGTGRLFVATRNGDIRIVSATGTVSPTLFLNVSTSPGVSLYTQIEGGFPGLAFSPNYNAPIGTPGRGKFYTFTTETYSAANPADFSQPELLPAAGGAAPNNQIVIREWSVSADPNVANTTSRVLLRINHPDGNHQGGALKFGSDGYLYIGLGDGGGGNDLKGSATSTTDGHTNSVGNAQDTSVVFGKILRIDPKGTNSANGQYGIPSDNPFVVSGAGLKEIFAYGLRNPYRISLDRLTGKIYAGDVGQGAIEEVDIITNGGNFGWVFREGTRDNTTDSGRPQPNGFSSVAPIGQYSHDDGSGGSNGVSIIGEFVYRGSLLPALSGKYVFGDLNRSGTTIGRIFYMDAAGGTISQLSYDLSGGGVAPSSSLFSFGEDASGELYALFSSGQILQLIPEPGALSLLLLSLPAVLCRRRRKAGASL